MRRTRRKSMVAILVALAMIMTTFAVTPTFAAKKSKAMPAVKSVTVKSWSSDSKKTNVSTRRVYTFNKQGDPVELLAGTGPFTLGKYKYKYKKNKKVSGKIVAIAKPKTSMKYDKKGRLIKRSYRDVGYMNDTIYKYSGFFVKSRKYSYKYSGLKKSTYTEDYRVKLKKGVPVSISNPDSYTETFNTKGKAKGLLKKQQYEGSKTYYDFKYTIKKGKVVKAVRKYHNYEGKVTEKTTYIFKYDKKAKVPQGKYYAMMYEELGGNTPTTWY